MNRSEVEVDGAADYDSSLKKKVKKYPEKYGNITCEDAHIEKACRVWEWWCVKAVKFNYFFTAAYLVALVPVSSAAVECVFSQVEFLIETTGVSALKESLEIRVKEHVNHYPTST